MEFVNEGRSLDTPSLSMNKLTRGLASYIDSTTADCGESAGREESGLFICAVRGLRGEKSFWPRLVAIAAGKGIVEVEKRANLS
jgi:hypothetical protein